MRRVLTFNGKALSDFNAFWDGSQVFVKPERSVEKIEIMGKSGDLTIDNGRFTNLPLSFNCFIRDHFIENYEELMNYLYSQKGYQRLETSTEPDVYRMAQYNEANEPNTGAFLKYGSFTLEFDCMPQKWLKLGEIPISVSGTQVVLNPTRQEAKPLIMVTGTGTFRINTDTCTLDTNTGTTYIDCEIQDAYEGLINRNPNFTTTGESFPVLKEGNNNIEVPSGMTMTIVPRWWRL